MSQLLYPVELPRQISMLRDGPTPQHRKLEHNQARNPAQLTSTGLLIPQCGIAGPSREAQLHLQSSPQYFDRVEKLRGLSTELSPNRAALLGMSALDIMGGMDADSFWAELEATGEEAVRVKWNKLLYGYPGTTKYELVKGWLSQKEWSRSVGQAAEEGPPSGSEELDDLLPVHRRSGLNRDLVEFELTARQKGRPLALVIIDLDRFKTVNDRHGHPIGDEVLIGVSKILLRCIDGKGRAYRYGGDEMALLLQNHTTEETVALAERIRTELEESNLTELGLNITASIGVAVMPNHAEKTGQLVELADKALYQAKTLGRNLVRVSGDPDAISPRPRVTSRREPAAGGITDAEREQIRLSYFREHQARCPRDLALLKVIESSHLASDTTSLLIVCPMCGLRETID